MRMKNRVAFKFAGVCILVGAILCTVALVGGATGVMHNNYYEYDTKPVQVAGIDQANSLDFDIGIGSLFVQLGDTFKVEHNFKDKYIDIKMNNGTLKIDTNVSRRWGFNFGFGFNRGQDHGTIIVTIPNDSTFDHASIAMGLGEAKIDEIIAQKGTISVGTGRVEIKNLVTTESTTFDAGVGELVVKKMEIANAKVECGIGSVKLTGSMQGDNKLECGVGNIEAHLIDSQENYYFTSSTGIGNVQINNNKTVMGNGSAGNPDAPVKVDISCGIGNVSVWNR